MPLVKARIQVFCKVEATDGTFTLAAPAAADLVPEVYDIQIPDGDVDLSPRNDARGNLTKSPSVVGGTKGKMSFKMRLIGGSAAGTAGTQSNVWKSSGYSETVSAGVSVTYKRANDLVGYSYAVIVDGHMLGMRGCRADMTFDFEAGVPKIANVEIQGGWVTPTDVALVTPSAQAIVPTAFMGPATLTVMDETTAIIKKLTVKAGNKVVVRSSMLDSKGYIAAKIIDAKPVASVDPESALTVSNARWADFASGGSGVLSFTAPTTDPAGNKLAFTASACQWSALKHGERDGFMTEEGEIEIGASQSAGEGGDYSFIWT